MGKGGSAGDNWKNFLAKQRIQKNAAAAAAAREQRAKKKAYRKTLPWGRALAQAAQQESESRAKGYKTSRRGDRLRREKRGKAIIRSAQERRYHNRGRDIDHKAVKQNVARLVNAKKLNDQAGVKPKTTLNTSLAARAVNNPKKVENFLNWVDSHNKVLDGPDHEKSQKLLKANASKQVGKKGAKKAAEIASKQTPAKVDTPPFIAAAEARHKRDAPRRAITETIEKEDKRRALARAITAQSKTGGVTSRKTRLKKAIERNARMVSNRKREETDKARRDNARNLSKQSPTGHIVPDHPEWVETDEGMRTRRRTKTVRRPKLVWRNGAWYDMGPNPPDYEVDDYTQKGGKKKVNVKSQAAETDRIFTRFEIQDSRDEDKTGSKNPKKKAGARVDEKMESHRAMEQIRGRWDDEDNQFKRQMDGMPEDPGVEKEHRIQERAAANAGYRDRLTEAKKAEKADEFLKAHWLRVAASRGKGKKPRHPNAPKPPPSIWVSGEYDWEEDKDGKRTRTPRMVVSSGQTVNIGSPVDKPPEYRVTKDGKVDVKSGKKGQWQKQQMATVVRLGGIVTGADGSKDRRVVVRPHGGKKTIEVELSGIRHPKRKERLKESQIPETNARERQTLIAKTQPSREMADTGIKTGEIVRSRKSGQSAKVVKVHGDGTATIRFSAPAGKGKQKIVTRKVKTKDIVQSGGRKQWVEKAVTGGTGAEPIELSGSMGEEVRPGAGAEWIKQETVNSLGETEERVVRGDVGRKGKTTGVIKHFDRPLRRRVVEKMAPRPRKPQSVITDDHPFQSEQMYTKDPRTGKMVGVPGLVRDPGEQFTLHTRTIKDPETGEKKTYRVYYPGAHRNRRRGGNQSVNTTVRQAGTPKTSQPMEYPPKPRRKAWQTTALDLDRLPNRLAKEISDKKKKSGEAGEARLLKAIARVANEKKVTEAGQAALEKEAAAFKNPFGDPDEWAKIIAQDPGREEEGNGKKPKKGLSVDADGYVTVDKKDEKRAPKWMRRNSPVYVGNVFDGKPELMAERNEKTGKLVVKKNARPYMPGKRIGPMSIAELNRDPHAREAAVRAYKARRSGGTKATVVTPKQAVQGKNYSGTITGPFTLNGRAFDPSDPNFDSEEFNKFMEEELKKGPLKIQGNGKSIQIDEDAAKPIGPKNLKDMSEAEKAAARKTYSKWKKGVKSAGKGGLKGLGGAAIPLTAYTAINSKNKGEQAVASGETAAMIAAFTKHGRHLAKFGGVPLTLAMLTADGMVTASKNKKAFEELKGTKEYQQYKATQKLRRDLNKRANADRFSKGKAPRAQMPKLGSFDPVAYKYGKKRKQVRAKYGL